MAATESAYEAIDKNGPMTANRVYQVCDAFEDEAHCSRVLAQMATREPVRLVRRKVDNPNSGRGGPRQVYEYDTMERARSVVATDLNGKPLNPTADLLGQQEAAHSPEQNQPSALLDRLLSMLAVQDADEAARKITEMRTSHHAALNDAAAYRMVIEAVMGRVGADSPETVLDTIDRRLAAASKAGRPALILVADDDSADVMELPIDVDPQQKAMELVCNGEIREAVVAMLIGRAVMPKPAPEWVPA